MSSSDSFVHLHVHTEYSMLDGAARLGELFEATARMGMPAVAMTDHGNVFGAYDFYKQARAAGVKPIIGMEAYLTPGTHRSERKRVRWGEGGGDDVSGGGAFTHMTLLAESTKGMHNLFRLSSRSSLEGFFYKARADRELLNEYAEGLIADRRPARPVRSRPSAPGRVRQGPGRARGVPGHLRQGKLLPRADGPRARHRDRVRDGLLRLGKDLEPAAAGDQRLPLHQPRRTPTAHEALLCVQTGKTLADPTRFKLDGGGYYLKSPQEMRDIWEGTHGLREACDNTLLIAERCDITFNENANFMPRFPVPEGESEDTWLVKEVDRGLLARYPGGVPDDVRARADFETGVILSMGFPGYFLVVADFINWAKEHGIRVGPGRGSGAGSMVAYAMRITDLDPLVHGLLFERFLNPDRVSMPDFDIDFDERRRGEVIRYVTEKYGDDRVPRSSPTARSRPSRRSRTPRACSATPSRWATGSPRRCRRRSWARTCRSARSSTPTDKRYGEGGEFRALYESDADVRKVVDTAKGLEGLKRQWGVHAAGVIMSSEPLLDVIPIMRREQDGAIITQFDYPTCEQLGLIKMDFLGLRNLTVLDDALTTSGATATRSSCSRTSSSTTRRPTSCWPSGDTLGVFQLDGGPDAGAAALHAARQLRGHLRRRALYRPGPDGRDAHNNYARARTAASRSSRIHPELAEPLAEILGRDLRPDRLPGAGHRHRPEAGGLLRRQADLLRRPWARRRGELDAELVRLPAGMSSAATRTRRSHAVGHLGPVLRLRVQQGSLRGLRVVSFWTAYLKAHYPAEYMAALLTSVGDSKDRMALYLSECRRMGISVLPPDVNDSAGDFTAVGEDIRFGLHAVRNVGTNVVAGIVAAREEKGKFSDFSDFMDKVPAIVCQKKVVESLAKAGAFDSLGHGRRALVAIHEDAVDQHADIKRNEAIGQDSLFGGLDDADFGSMTVQVPDIPEWDKQTLLGFEREMLGPVRLQPPADGARARAVGLGGLHDRVSCSPTSPRRTTRPSRSAG
jgi:DNA polymerase-3 subunit alpha